MNIDTSQRFIQVPTASPATSFKEKIYSYFLSIREVVKRALNFFKEQFVEHQESIGMSIITIGLSASVIIDGVSGLGCALITIVIAMPLLLNKFHFTKGRKKSIKETAHLTLDFSKKLEGMTSSLIEKYQLHKPIVETHDRQVAKEILTDIKTLLAHLEACNKENYLNSTWQGMNLIKEVLSQRSEQLQTALDTNNSNLIEGAIYSIKLTINSLDKSTKREIQIANYILKKDI